MNLRLDPCIPPLWAPGGHAQTILGHFLPSPALASKGKRIEIRMPDGDKLVGFVLAGTSSTVVYLFHGLSGSTDSTYIHRTALVAQAQGHTVIMLNHRGCGEGLGLAKLPYHSGRAEDLSAAIDFGRKKFPRHKHLAIGFSLSGNALLLLLTGRRGTTKPDFAISVNAPIHLESAAFSLKKGINRIYDIDFVRRCTRDARLVRGGEFEFPAWGTLHDFDNAYTAPAGGFQNREHYYQSCSTWNQLSRITTPTIILTAKNDPFVGYEHYASARISPSIQLHIEDFGGHLGYLSKDKTALGTNRWLDYFLDSAIGAFHRKR